MKQQSARNPDPPPSVVKRALDIVSNEKTEGVPLEVAAKTVGEHLLHRLNPKTIGTEVAATLTVKLKQGADEIAHALFGNGHAYAPYGYQFPPPIEGPTVHGPEETVEEKAAKAVEFDEAKSAAKREAVISKEVASMDPELQAYANSFRQPPLEMDEPEY